ncbi:MAG: hypothetical protein B6244_04085 [Candidatus Cloacimonetes bacterium 4572_55]|nr:MAG: hypothetical protein B6244_04085 [Candidatus Cloacimonetes bacterium 4572_55]
MKFPEFKRILSKFVDRPDDMDFNKDQAVIQIQNQVIDFRTKLVAGSIHVIESDCEFTAERWIADRLAKLPLLADRILTYIPENPNFIDPYGLLSGEFDDSPDKDVSGVARTTLDVLSRQLGISTSVLYLTSDAGEGKTTVINRLARIQARAYKDKRSEWLLAPIPLGGRHFLRLDDVIVGSIANRLRFLHLYYDNFIELVKLGFIVPGFDGFEEMFVVGASGEAVSSLGNLISKLNSSGNVMVAARKAYYEIRDFEAQSRLIDSMQDCSVSFSRLQIKRWTKKHFLDYWKKRGLKDGKKRYDTLCKKFSEDHPLLTRAVLVKKLTELAADTDRFENLLKKLDSGTSHYFSDLVDSIIEREIENKWLDRSGDGPRKPLITLQEHHELLSLIALEMLNGKTSLLGQDLMQFVGELFCEMKNLPTGVSRQVQNRIFDHPLLVKPEKHTNSYAFDHEEFKEYFLGEGIARIILEEDTYELKMLFRKEAISAQSLDSVYSFLSNNNFDPEKSIKLLSDIALRGASSSYSRENCGGLIVRILRDVEVKSRKVEHVAMGSELFVGSAFKNIVFYKCHFRTLCLEGATLEGCNFRSCRFETIELFKNTKIVDCHIEDCEIHSLQKPDDIAAIYEPEEIVRTLKISGFSLPEEEEEKDEQEEAREQDEDLTILTRALRPFSRTTGVTDVVFRRRLGLSANRFIDNILPDLLQRTILKEIEYRGGGQCRRFLLGIQMSKISQALIDSKGSYQNFLDMFEP